MGGRVEVAEFDDYVGEYVVVAVKNGYTWVDTP